MAFRWKLGQLTTGAITRTDPLPVTRSSGSVDLDIHSEDSTRITIPLGELSDYERNNWRDVFAELRAFAVLENDAVAWDAPGAVLFAGFVNKITPKIKPSTIELQLTGLQEYTKARIIGETFSDIITDPTRSVSFEASSWEGVMNALVKRMFDNSPIPAGLPRIPEVLGTVGASAGAGRKKTVFITDAVSYGTALKEVSETDSGLGLEYRFVPRWADSSKSKIVWDFLTGSEAYPHINEIQTVALALSENEEKISAWDTTIDSNDLYSSLYLQSRGGSEETKDGADFTGLALTAQKFPILVERFFNPGVELTDGQRAEQLQARIKFAGQSKYTAGFTVEENGNPGQWMARLGCTLNISGLPDTISAGHNANLRCVGVSFTPGKGTVSIEVMQKQPVYPRLPKKRTGEMIAGKDRNENTRIQPSTGGTGGGGVTPPVIPQPPTPGGGGGDWGIDGEFSSDDLWGNEGHAPGSSQQELKNPVAGNFRTQEEVYSSWDGLMVIDPQMTVQDKGNRLYGLDRRVIVAQTTDINGEITHRGGGLNKSTGAFLEPLPSLFVKKTYFTTSGDFGKVETVAEFPGEKLASDCMAEYDTNDYPVGYFLSGFEFANWVLGGFYYLMIMHNYGNADNPAGGVGTGNEKYCINGRTTVFRKVINSGTGKLEGDWEDVTSIWALPEGFFPRMPAYTTWGDNIAFLATKPTPKKIKNWNETQWIQNYESHFEKFGIGFPFFGIRTRLLSLGITGYSDASTPPGGEPINLVTSVGFIANKDIISPDDMIVVKNPNAWEEGFESEPAPTSLFYKNKFISMNGFIDANEPSALENISKWNIIKRSGGGNMDGGYVGATTGFRPYYGVKGWTCVPAIIWNRRYEKKMFLIKVSSISNFATPEAVDPGIDLARILFEDDDEDRGCTYSYLSQNASRSRENYYEPIPWTAEATNYNILSPRISRVFSYNGRLLNFALSSNGGINIRSCAITEGG